ncbi:hypothetical protein KC19_1G151600, partial [Ceratodon purpureus]
LFSVPLFLLSSGKAKPSSPATSESRELQQLPFRNENLRRRTVTKAKPGGNENRILSSTNNGFSDGSLDCVSFGICRHALRLFGSFCMTGRLQWRMRPAPSSSLHLCIVRIWALEFRSSRILSISGFCFFGFLGFWEV